MGDMSNLQQHKCLEKQVKFMSVFYLALTCIDIMFLFLGDEMFEKHDIECLDSMIIIVKNNSAASFLLFNSILFFAFSILIWYIFY